MGIRDDWAAHAAALAPWSLSRLVVRRDVFGAYTADGRQYTAHEMLDDAVLQAHYRGERTVGAHSTNPENKCICITWDIDAHGPGDDAVANRAAADAVTHACAPWAMIPLVCESNGAGGYHVRLLLARPVPAVAARWAGERVLAALVAAGHAPCEVFPKQGELTLERPYGNWLRLPGRHHKRDHWTRILVPGTSRWIEGAAACKLLLAQRGCNPSMLLEEYRESLAEEEKKKTTQEKSRKARPARDFRKADEAEVRSALEAIPAHMADSYGGTRDDTGWLGIGMALNDWDISRGLDLWKDFSARSPKYDPKICEDKWATFSPGKGLSIATIFKFARVSGWKPPREAARPAREAPDPGMGRGGGNHEANGDAALDVAMPPPPPRIPGPAAIDAGLADLHRTDLGNAERLVARHGADLRYCHPWGAWLAWDGRRWRPDDTAEIRRRARDAVRAIVHEALAAPDDAQRKALLSWSLASEKRDRLSAMVHLAEAQEGIPILVADMDRDPWLFNCANGTVDLRTGTLRDHDRGDLLTKLCPHDFEPEAACPLWEETLARFFARPDPADREALISYWRRLCGYAMVGLVRDHVLPVAYGKGSNGKSTILGALIDVFGGDYAMKAPPDMFMSKKSEAHPTERADLFGKRLVVAIETEQGRRLNETMVKELTGGDAIRARRMREDFWEFKPTHTMLMATNHKPVVRDTSLGIWRRLRLVPFTVSIPDDEADRGMGEKLLAEASGILGWCVRGCLEWQRDGLDTPSEVDRATGEYRAEQDTLGAFMEECTVTIPGARVRAGRLYERYKEWCESSNERTMTLTAFGNAITERGIEKEKGIYVEYLGLGIADRELSPSGYAGNGARF